MSGKDDDKKNSLYARYNNLLVKYPYFVNATQSGVLTALGVVISQILSTPVGEATNYNFREVQIMTLINVVWITPVLLWFFGILSKLNRNNLDKLLIDQLIFSPPFTASIVGLRYLILDGGDVYALPNLLMQVVPGIQLTAWLFWVPTRFLIINYVPPSLAILVNSAAALVWNVIFIMLLNK